MAKGQGKTGLIVTIVVLGLTLLTVSGLVIWQNATRTSTTQPPSTETTADKPTTQPTTTETTPVETPTPIPVDPETLTSIDIEPMKLAVFYTKGTGAFEYAIMRTADHTEYVEFSSMALVGTKCTNDNGVFASIIKNPSSTEDQTTISAKTTVNSDTYGLSLPAGNCTSDQALLKEYQAAFSNGFSQLKAL